MNNTLGERIREKRSFLKLSQDELAEAVGVNRVTLSKYERNLIEPSSSKLLLLASKLGCSTSYLMGEESTQQPSHRAASLPNLSSDPVPTLTPEETTLIRAYRAADTRAREDALHTLLSHPKAQQQESLA